MYRKTVVVGWIVCAGLGVWAQESVVFQKLDLRPVVNTDPLSATSPFAPEVDLRVPYYTWIEGESFKKKSRDGFGVENRKRASQGVALGGGFGAETGDWAEWYFDLPWESENGQLYLRMAREDGHNSVGTYLITFDGRTMGQASIPSTGGGGDEDFDFERGYSRMKMGRLTMGRHVIRVTAHQAGDVAALDGFWFSDGEIDIVNRVDEKGVIMKPAHYHNLLLPVGERTIHGVPYEFIDPAANDRKAFYLSPEDLSAAVALPVGGSIGRKAHILAAGMREEVRAWLSAVYSDGSQDTHDITMGPLFAGAAGDAVAQFGKNRYGYHIEAALKEQPLDRLEISGATGRFVIVAVTLERAK